MKYTFLFLLFIISHCVISQQLLQKVFETTLNEIEIETFGLDEIKIMNTNSNKIEVSLYDENPNAHSIYIQELSDVLKIGFELSFYEEPDIFKKYITKRLHRASVIIKLPKNKAITLNGNHVDIISESYIGDLNIYIDKGLVKLHQVQGNVLLKLFQGNVFAELSDSNINLISNKGIIKVNNYSFQKKYLKELKNSAKSFKVNSIKANIFLISK